MINRRTVLAMGAGAAVSGLTGTTAFAQEKDVVDMTIGDANAPVTFIEYASLTCPHCARFHEEVLPLLKADYVDTGKVQFVYREVYFNQRPALWAAMVARCGGEMRYFAIVDMLFKKQREWLASSNPVDIVNGLRKVGKSAGLSDAELDTCLQDAALAEAMVANYQKNMEEYEITGTPSMVIDGTLYSNMAYPKIKEILDAQLVN